MPELKGVKFTRPDYDYALTDWSLIGDVCEGERAIKDARERYLPRPNPFDTSKQNSDRYDSYLARSVFYNATGHTLRGMIGAIFRKEPETDLPAQIEYANEDVSGSGVSLGQQSQAVTKEVLGKGRHGLWVDHPTTQSASIADQQSGSVRANIISIDASRITNWQTTSVGGRLKLSLVVIKEQSDSVAEDGFTKLSSKQYRVLRLVESVYQIEIWRPTTSEAEKFELAEVFVPTMGNGSTWGEIPFVFVGANNNDPDIDHPPMLDLATLNIAHYRNSADYEDSAFFCGQAQPWMSGLTEDWAKMLEKKGLFVGSRNPIPLPEGGAFGIAQAQPNTLVKEAMDSKERQMVALGARLLEKGGAVKTATQSQSESESEHSVLSLVAENVSNAYQKCLTWCAEFMNASGEVVFDLNTDFANYLLDSQMITALIQAWQSGNLPASDLWSQFRRAGLIDNEKDDEAIKEELSSEDSGLELDEE